jgi:hypothetical protein
MDLNTRGRFSRRQEWRFLERKLLITLYIALLAVQTSSQTTKDTSQESLTKTDSSLDKVDNNHCHSCHSNSNNENIKLETIQIKNESAENVPVKDSLVDDVIEILGTITKRYVLVNKTETQIKKHLENVLSQAISQKRFEIIDGVEIKAIDQGEVKKTEAKPDEGRALFSKFSYEYRLYQKFKNFIDTHVLSINLPKAAKLMGFRCKYPSY